MQSGERRAEGCSALHACGWAPLAGEALHPGGREVCATGRKERVPIFARAG